MESESEAKGGGAPRHPRAGDAGPSAEDRARTVTRWLNQPPEAREVEDLWPLVYDELRELARARMAREAHEHTLQATVLVHEAYLRLVGEAAPEWNGRGHFFGAAALAMRRILVEQARRRKRHKRGGDRKRVELDDACAAIDPPGEDVLAVDEALRELEARDARKGRIVNLRYFAGLTAAETAEVLGVSIGTIEREWRFIKVWLRDRLDEPD